MLRLNVLAGALGAALLMNSGAFAQVAADPNNPNETVPDAMNPPAYGEPISTENAKKAAAAAVAEAQKRNWSGLSALHHHSHFTAFDMTSPMVSSTAAHTKAEMTLAN